MAMKNPTMTSPCNDDDEESNDDIDDDTEKVSHYDM